MEGQAFINGKDIWTTWGALLLGGAYEELLKPAPMKEYIENKSRNQNGVRLVANESNSRYDKRNVTLGVLIDGSSVTDYLSKYEAFLSELSKGVFILKVPRLKRTYKLVYTDCAKYGNYGETKGKFTLKLIEPNPADREFLQ